MHDTLVLLSTLGGITTFGATMLMVGPVMAAMFLAMWELCERDYAEE